MQAVRDIKTEPPAGFKGSPTFANILAFLEKGLTRIPVLGDMASGVVRGAQNIRQMGQAGRDVRQAMGSPLNEARTNALRNMLRGERRQNALRALRWGPPALPLLLENGDNPEQNALATFRR